MYPPISWKNIDVAVYAVTTKAAVWMEWPWSVSMGARWAINAISTIDVKP